MSNPALRYYACGETDHQLADLYDGRPEEVRTFPAGVFLFEHSNGERVLFDTGYSTRIYDSGIKGAIYRKILPPRVREQDNINRQLLNDGIEPSSIGYVVLSHFHPDHIAGVQYFPDAHFVVSAEAAEVAASPKIRDGFLKKLLPSWFKSVQKTVLSDIDLESKSHGLIQGYDFFDDESLLLTKLPGHARGQMGALVMEQSILGIDASWGRDLLGDSRNMRLLGKLANYDMAAYQRTISRLIEIESEGVELYFSHDTYDRKILIS